MDIVIALSLATVFGLILASISGIVDDCGSYYKDKNKRK